LKLGPSPLINGKRQRSNRIIILDYRSRLKTSTMKIAISTAVLAALVAPAFSLSYLESLTGNPVSLAPAGGSIANGAAYLSAIQSPVSTAPTGAGMASYLDALPRNVAPSMSGPGMASYTNALSPNAHVASSPPVAAAPAAPAAVAAAPVAAAPAAPVASAGAPTGTGPKGYLDSVTAVASAGAPTGAGITGYLDAMPPATSAIGGAGIKSHVDVLPISNTVAGTGVSTYTDNLSGGKTASSKSFSPFGSKPLAPSFVGSVGGAQIGFTLEASDLSSLVEQLRGSGGTIKLSGSIDSISVF
jgi:hypothetical protein